MSTLAEPALEALGGRFVVERELGRGGMATVYLAHDRVLDRRVAVKVLSLEQSAAFGGERFAREIRVTARLVHPNIVPLFDSGEAEGRLFYVMPHVEGETLRMRLQRERRLPVEFARALAIEIAEALAYAHGQGIVHRDIKPENIFVYGGRALVADFGIAKTVGEPESNGQMTLDGTLIGTVAYMSPEQARGESALDGRSDLYALGCILHEMLAGAPPFVGDSPMRVLVQHLMDEPPGMPADIPGDIASIVGALLAKDRADRPATAGALLDALRARTDSGAHAMPTVAIDAPAVAKASLTAARKASMEAYAEGRAHWRRGFQGGANGRAKIEIALTYLERARDLDPTNPLPLIGLADAVHVLGYRGFAPEAAAYAQARELRLQALRLDERVAELHSGIAVMNLYWEDDFEQAGRSLERALELDPNLDEALRFMAIWFKIMGRLEDAIAIARRAVALQPSLSAGYNALGDVLMASGRYDEAITPLRTALRCTPGLDPALERLELACHRAGRADESLAARRALLGHRGETARAAALEEDIARFGWSAARELDLRRDLARQLDRATHEDPFVDQGRSRQLSDDIICLYADLGEWSRAMDWVERGYHRRPGRLRRVLMDFPYDRRGLGADPRFAPLLRTAGLEELL